jgi:hypothetical protein
MYAEVLDPPKVDGGPLEPVGCHHSDGTSILLGFTGAIVQRWAGVFRGFKAAATTGAASSKTSGWATQGWVSVLVAVVLKAAMTRGAAASAATRSNIPPRPNTTGNIPSG